MLPFIAAGIVFIGAGGAALYKYFSNEDEKSQSGKKERIDIGSIALWGVPNSGKSTFVKRLLGENPSEKKIQTMNVEVHKNLEFESNGTIYNIELIRDMPGVDTRKSDWLKHVEKSKNSIYLINLERLFVEQDYLRKVLSHLRELREALAIDENKNLMIIGTHLDKTEFSQSEESNNLIQQTDHFDRVREVFHSVWFYSVNLLDDCSCRNLIQSIVSDINAKS